MLIYSPQIFLFLSVYRFFLFLMSNLDSFFIFWSVMEISTLVFMGVSYSIIKNNFSSLLSFFIIQALAAFSLLVFYCLGSAFGFSVALLLKLSMFPFYFWYMNIVFNFPNLIFFFSSSFFKLPSVFIIYIFYEILDYKMITCSSVLTVLGGAMIIVVSSELRLLLIASSVVNNSWFYFSQLVNITFFFLYFFMYVTFLFLIIYQVSCLTSLNNFTYIPYNILIVFLLFRLAGFPPFPLFYAKILVVLNLVSLTSFSFGILIFIVSVVLRIVGYLKHVFISIFYKYRNRLLSFSNW